MDRETEALLSALDDQRQHVLGIIDGLAPESLLRPVLPTGWSCAGLVRHLTYDVEQFWFRRVMLGETIPAEEQEAGERAWTVPDGVSPDQILDEYRREVARATTVITNTPLDTAPMAWPELFGEWRMADLREIVLHGITETACHAGHLDAARELIDGRTWMVLD
jgi:uncharacterized damage-inducible protein DinB